MINPSHKIGAAGKRGETVRSDCFVEISFKKSGGINLKLESKVGVLYGDSIQRLVFEMCERFGLKHANIFLEDKGALPFTIAARFETALKRAQPELEAEFLLPINGKKKSPTSKDRLRRSRLYLPGDEPKFFVNAGLHKPDGIILDLEDSVAPSEKDAARVLVRNALRCIDFYGAERMVRINQNQAGLKDLRYIVPHHVDVILIPKCESAQQVIAVENEVAKLRRQFDVANEIYFLPIIESALGVIKAYEIASASLQNCGLAIGLEDYTADLGVERTREGEASRFGRSIIVNAAKAAGIQALDSVFSGVNDLDGLRAGVIEAKSLGFEGKGCIHPRQIQIIHAGFAPTQDEISKAMRVVMAFEEAQNRGIGVVALDAKMIDAPVVKRAQRTIKLARLHQLIDTN
jgi:citrate lyase subunit beta/citryl-CoA lyase